MAVVLKNGKKLPSLGIGTHKIQEDHVMHALKKGVQHIDAATGYDNLPMIKDAIHDSGVSVDQLFLTLKLNRVDFENGVRDSVEKCLRTLGVKIDLLLIHTPDDDLPMGRILEELSRLQTEKKIGGIGVSNFTLPQLKWCVERNFPVLVNQVEFHPYFQQWELKRYCDNKGIVLCAYRPLGKGKVCSDEKLKAIGSKYRKSPAQVAWRWALQLGMPIISKVSAEQHLDEYVNLFDFQLTEKELEEIQKLNTSEPTCIGYWSESIKPGHQW